MNEQKVYTIGRNRSCHIVLADDSVSNKHATLSFLPNNKLLLTDLGSTNHTWLIKGKSEERITKEYISPTDMVKFGECRMAVKELIEYIHSLTPPSQVTASSENEGEKVKGRILIRCENCGHVIKHSDPICPNCNYKTRRSA